MAYFKSVTLDTIKRLLKQSMGSPIYNLNCLYGERGKIKQNLELDMKDNYCFFFLGLVLVFSAP